MGIKLNSEVAGLICRAFVFLTRVWEGGPSARTSSSPRPLTDSCPRSLAAVLEPVLTHLPVALIGCAGFLGASSLLALSVDLVAVLTLPFFACYVAATLVYRWSLRSLGALFNVFRGASRSRSPSLSSRPAEGADLTCSSRCDRAQVQPAAEPRRAGELRRRCAPPRHAPLRHAVVHLPDARRLLRRLRLGACSLSPSSAAPLPGSWLMDSLIDSLASSSSASRRSSSWASPASTASRSLRSSSASRRPVDFPVRSVSQPLPALEMSC